MARGGTMLLVLHPAANRHRRCSMIRLATRRVSLSWRCFCKCRQGLLRMSAREV